jgi:hypothetical protein
MPSWCRQVTWGNCGISWVNCAVLCMKDDLKGQFFRPALLPVKTAQFTQLFHQVWRHTKVAQFNWECIGRLKCCSACVTLRWNIDVGSENRVWLCITRNAYVKVVLLRKLVVTRLMKNFLAFCRTPLPPPPKKKVCYRIHAIPPLDPADFLNWWV